MQMKTQLVVKGAKPTNNEFEGVRYDHLTVYTDVQLDQKSGAIGMAGAEYRWGLSENIKKFQGVELPCLCDVTLEVVTSGKVQKMIIVDLVPVAKPLHNKVPVQ